MHEPPAFRSSRPLGWRVSFYFDADWPTRFGDLPAVAEDFGRFEDDCSVFLGDRIGVFFEAALHPYRWFSLDFICLSAADARLTFLDSNFVAVDNFELGPDCWKETCGPEGFETAAFRFCGCDMLWLFVFYSWLLLIFLMRLEMPPYAPSWA